MVRYLVTCVAAILGIASGTGCRPPTAGDPAAAERAALADWGGREVPAVPAPAGWITWDSGDGVRVATPVALRSRPTPGLTILQAEHGDVGYQVNTSTDPPNVKGPFRPAEFFEAFLNSFASSSGLDRDGPTERLRMGAYPAAQARFKKDNLRAVVRVVRLGPLTVALAALAAGPLEETDPAVGGFLNSLTVDGGRP